MNTELTVEKIAEICHEANRVYCQALGDNSQLPWRFALDWQKKSAIDGVKFKQANPDATPEDMHKSWLEQKRADGWRYGAVKNPEKKEHPCFVPYESLPAEQQAKDALFSAIVVALTKPAKAA